MTITEQNIRAAAFAWLSEQAKHNGGIFERDDLIYKFSFQNQNITLLGASGIWFPRGFSLPISITTTGSSPYNDGINDEGFLEYSYRGNNPKHRDNIGLVKVFEQGIPLIYFNSIKPGKYSALWPVYIIQNDPANLKIKAAISTNQGLLYSDKMVSEQQGLHIREQDVAIRRYITTVIKQRLHQSTFREFVLEAYSRQCTMCRLQHEELLDAAHITPDSEQGGEPIINNGLSLCKIHHAAYDHNIIGITPDFTIKVKESVMNEIDGPMLKYGLQYMDNTKIMLPKSKADYPDKDRLAKRYDYFLNNISTK